MKVKIRCKCGAERMTKKDTLKEARKVKRISRNGNYLCDKCKFRLKVRSIVREIVSGVNYDTYR